MIGWIVLLPERFHCSDGIDRFLPMEERKHPALSRTMRFNGGEPAYLPDHHEGFFNRGISAWSLKQY
jgi:hypothetical protein